MQSPSLFVPMILGLPPSSRGRNGVTKILSWLCPRAINMKGHRNMYASFFQNIFTTSTCLTTMC